MDLNAAKICFKNLLKSLKAEDRVEFLSWCEEYHSGSNVSNAYFDLRTIAEDIKTEIPLEAILPSEYVANSRISDSNSESGPIVHVDSFLYEDEHIDALVEEGELSRNYCRDCKSLNISPITFISHSASIKRIEFIFKNLLPDLTGKVLLDVGSRLGAILYGAYYYSSARKIIGVEINKDLCALQEHMVHKYGLNDRIKVICNDICTLPEVLKSANVIVFNNVFQCFMPANVQKLIWVFLRETLSVPGTILVTVPSIEETLKDLQTGIDISSWLRRIPARNLRETDDPDLEAETCCYIVL